MSAEYGVFEHGTAMVDGPFYGDAGHREAQTVADALTDADDGNTPYTVAEVCPDHAEEPRATCGECFGGEP
ncbi:hypothetical protein [Streptomyces rimosus]|uniref:hypothetical protein n=1 Tax=Streptomyces rimosus TaxID=1927 RepID=UPI000A97B7BE|nr:hypothetical protein [Streptomyces rimosus]